jgi:hypothetical protein
LHRIKIMIVRSWRVAQWHVNQPRKQVDTLGQSVCGQQASPHSSARLSRRRCIQRHAKIAGSGVDNLVAIQRGLLDEWQMQRTEGGAMPAIARQLSEFLAHSPGRTEDSS